MPYLNIIRIRYSVKFTNRLHITVVSVLPGADANQSIPRLNYIAHRLSLLLGFYFSDGRSLNGNLLSLRVIAARLLRRIFLSG